MHKLHKVGIVVNVLISLLLMGYVGWLQRCLAHEKSLVARLPKIIKMARDEVWSEVAEERAKAAKERVEAARLRAPPTCPACACSCPKCPKCKDCQKCPAQPKCKECPKCPAPPPKCKECPAPPKCKECPEQPKCPVCKCKGDNSKQQTSDGPEWLVTSFEWPENSDPEAHVQALECLRIVVCDRMGLPAHKTLRMAKGAEKDRSAVKAAKRSIALRTHPDKVLSDWARPICVAATQVVNGIR